MSGRYVTLNTEIQKISILINENPDRYRAEDEESVENMLSGILDFAITAHEGQKRKGTKIPYIVHPIETAIILAQNNASNEAICAGILHDVLEDTVGDENEICERLDRVGLSSERVLQIVYGTSEPSKLLAKQGDVEEESWKERKVHTIKYLESLGNDELSVDIKLVACADKLSNIRAMVNDYEQYKKEGKDGSELFERFNAPSSDQQWYYEALVIALKDLVELPMYREFADLVLKLFTKLS